VADLSMPEVNGLDACRQIRIASPRTKIVLVTAGGDEWVARAAFRAGASAFVLKHSAADVAKHSRARDGSVTVTWDGGRVRLEIADSGAGFEPVAADRAGLGLISMRERVGVLKGDLSAGPATFLTTTWSI
jgi:CheY-like chemotaxis protein